MPEQQLLAENNSNLQLIPGNVVFVILFERFAKLLLSLLGAHPSKHQRFVVAKMPHLNVTECLTIDVYLF